MLDGSVWGKFFFCNFGGKFFIACLTEAVNWEKTDAVCGFRDAGTSDERLILSEVALDIESVSFSLAIFAFGNSTLSKSGFLFFDIL